MNKIALVDYSKPSASKEFCLSMKETGFAVLKNHKIDHKLIGDVFSEWKNFFSLQAKIKNQYLFKRNFKKTQGGFFPQEVSETAKGFSTKDLKEFFHYYPDSDLPLPREISSKTDELRSTLLELSKTLLSWLEESLPNTIKQQLSMPLSQMVDEKHQTLLRILHYPPLPKTIEENSIRAAAHEDINLITLLLCNDEPGLQALDLEGKWHNVPSHKDFITVNLADMIEECCKSYYTATKHRVINPKGSSKLKSRYSIPLFLHPRDEVILSERYTAKKYRLERLEELGLL